MLAFFGPLVLKEATTVLKDRNQPGSRRSELRSCKVLKIEQIYLLKLLHLKVTLIQHRGRNPIFQ